MKPSKTRVRKMRPRRPSQARSTNGIRQTYHDPAIVAAKAARRRAENQTGDRP